MKTQQDDEAFIRYLVEDISSRLRIDASRVYISGHSLGSVMAQRCVMTMPGLFAAAACNAGVIGGGALAPGSYDLPDIREDLLMPIWLQIGDCDVGGANLETNQHARRAVDYWVARNNLDPNDHAAHDFGRYNSRVWLDADRAPLFVYTIAYEKVHAMIPQDSWFYYDMFLSKFSRDADGALRYMGKRLNANNPS